MEDLELISNVINDLFKEGYTFEEVVQMIDDVAAA